MFYLNIKFMLIINLRKKKLGCYKIYNFCIQFQTRNYAHATISIKLNLNLQLTYFKKYI